jgi:hypothetical protein
MYLNLIPLFCLQILHGRPRLKALIAGRFGATDNIEANSLPPGSAERRQVRLCDRDADYAIMSGG